MVELFARYAVVVGLSGAKQTLFIRSEGGDLPLDTALMSYSGRLKTMNFHQNQVSKKYFLIFSMTDVKVMVAIAIFCALFLLAVWIGTDTGPHEEVVNNIFK